MKVLIVGGSHQGKSAYADAHFGAEATAFRALHEYARERMSNGEPVAETVLAALSARGSWVVICDEIGCGPIPLDQFDRAYREQVGRLCCDIAEMADAVVRIVCGIPVAIKGELP